MPIGEVLDILVAIIKSVDFVAALGTFKQLIPVIERIISLFTMIFA